VIYQLYFDNVQLEHFGILRQQFWTFLHFPFHMALVLVMEGTNQLVSWRHVVEYIEKAFDPFFTSFEGGSLPELIAGVNETIITIFENPFMSLTEEVFNNVSGNFSALANSTISLPTEEQLSENLASILIDLLQLVVGSYGFEPPDAEAEGQKPPAETYQDYLNVFHLVFEYFFISAGLVLIFLGILSYLSHSKGRHESRSHYVSIFSKLVLGLATMLLAIMVRTAAVDNLGESAWTLPLVFFILAIALIFNHIPWGGTAKRTKDEDGSLESSRTA
jgi:uncharacterized membrane protein